MSLTQWVRAPSIQRVLWILGPSLKRHKGGEVSRRLKNSIGIRFSLFLFCFRGDVGSDWWCGFWWLIGDVSLNGWSVTWVWSVMWVLIGASGLERRCGAYDGCGVNGVLVTMLLGFDRERKRKKRKRKRQRRKKKKRRIG